MNWRSAIVLLSTCFFLTLIGFSFWQQDWQYALPTPKPQGLVQVEQGAIVNLSATLANIDSSRPTFLHFFNPSCPCSRFNLNHVRDLVQTYKTQVRFIAVLQGDQPNLTEAFAKLGLNMESIVDSDGAIARATGVYATPQAALINPDGKLYYRGNYNASRYCTLKNSEFARIALESILEGKPPSAIPPKARAAYGCPLHKKQLIKGGSAS